MRMPAVVAPGPTLRTDRTWRVAEPAASVWAAMGRTDRYLEWWPWLERFDRDGGLSAGASWWCTVRPPLPYAVRFRLDLHDISRAERVAARVSGDVEGTAELSLRSDGPATVLRLVAELRPSHPVLRSVASVARPVAEWGHDWVLGTAIRQFTERAGAET